MKVFTWEGKKKIERKLPFLRGCRPTTKSCHPLPYKVSKTYGTLILEKLVFGSGVNKLRGMHMEADKDDVSCNRLHMDQECSTTTLANINAMQNYKKVQLMATSGPLTIFIQSEINQETNDSQNPKNQKRIK